MLTAREFFRAAEQRFTTAEFLLENNRPLDAFYLAGYSIECVLKALIMHLTPVADQENTLYSAERECKNALS